MSVGSSNWIAGIVLAGAWASQAWAQGSLEMLTDERSSHLLARARLTLPASVSALWTDSDGLPGPLSPRFAVAATALLESPLGSPAADGTRLAGEVAELGSRQVKCLAYLAAGADAGRREVARLCVVQATELQWRLPVYVGHRIEPKEPFFAAAAGLALTGRIIAAGAKGDTFSHHAGRAWELAGLGQLATYGDRGETALCELAEAVVAAVGALPEDVNLHGTDEEFFAELDLRRDDMRDVAGLVKKRDYDGAKRAYTDALAARFSSAAGWPDIRLRKTADIDEADLLCRNVCFLQAHMFRSYELGDEIDWSAVVDDDIESRVWLNAQPWMLTLANAYQATGREKYVDHLCRLFGSWYASSPPTFRRSAAQWRTLEAGNRSAQVWAPTMLALAEHPTFREECLFDMARSALDHGKYLCMYAAGGGNWLQVESSGLACVALLFPEFRLAPLFYDVGMSRLSWVNARSFLPDGFQSECSPGYHSFPLRGVATVARLAAFRGAPVPEALMGHFEAGIEALMHIAYPDLTLPNLNDFNPLRYSCVEFLEAGADVFGRRHFEWFASGGKEGRAPRETSHDFTHAGYCVMRDRWGPDGQALIFDAGYLGAGHEHEDKLSFVYYAGGRELIGDPNIYSYKRDKYEPYWRGTWSHNTITIDGLSQHRALGPAEAIPDPDRRFHMGDGLDFAEGWYRRAYSERGSQVWEGQPRIRETEAKAALRDVEHQRCVLYIKGEYAVIFDRVVGKGRHEIDILFHPSPIETCQGIRRKARAVELSVNGDGTVVTEEADYANVAIIPVDGRRLEVLDFIGQDDPPRGWSALYGITPSHDIVYRYEGRLPAHFETVIQPLPEGRAPMPMKAIGQEATCRTGQTVAGLTCGDDLVLLSYDDPAEIVCGGVAFHGRALVLRDGEAHMVSAKSLVVDGDTVFSSEEFVDTLSVKVP